MSNKNRHYQLSALVVKDDTISRKVIEAVIKELGYLVIVVCNISEALHALNNIKFDFILISADVQSFDKIKYASIAINYGESCHDVCVGDVTICGWTEDREFFWVAGMNDSVPKPSLTNEIKVILDKVTRI